MSSGSLRSFRKWRDGQRENQEAEGPEAGGVLEKFNGVGAEAAGQRAPYEGGERGETNKEDRDLGPLVGKKAMHGFSS